MSRFLEPPPTVWDENAILRWMGSVFEAESLLEKWNTLTISDTSTLQPSDSGLVLCANTGAITINLPSAGAVGTGWWVRFIKTTADAVAVTLDPLSTETISGSATNAEMDARYDRLGIVSDGANWLIFDRGIS